MYYYCENANGQFMNPDVYHSLIFFFLNGINWFCYYRFQRFRVKEIKLLYWKKDLV